MIDDELDLYICQMSSEVVSYMIRHRSGLGLSSSQAGSCINHALNMSLTTEHVLNLLRYKKDF